MTLAALLFDVDGTLADTEPDGHLPAYNRAFAEFELDWHWSPTLYGQLLRIPGGRERVAYYLQAYEPPLGRHAERVASDHDAWIEDLHHCKSRYFRARVEQGVVRLRAGVARVMREAGAAGVPVAIVSNASRGSLEPVLEHLLGPDLLPGVAFALCGDEVRHKKPAPDLYQLACRHLHHYPGDCLAIEDSATGLQASYDAGVPTLITVNADTRDQTFDRARAVVDDLGEPDRPVTILKSPGFDFDYVNLDVLNRIAADARGDAA